MSPILSLLQNSGLETVVVLTYIFAFTSWRKSLLFLLLGSLVGIEYLYIREGFSFSSLATYFSSPPVEIKKTILEETLDYGYSMLDFVQALSIQNYMTLLTVMFFFVFCVGYTFMSLCSNIRTCLLKKKGWDYEAAVEGSSYNKDLKMPMCQIAFVIPGLVDTHVGYGVATKMGIVTAGHVANILKKYPQVGLVSSIGKKKLWKPLFEESERFSDISFAMIPKDVFSDLGIKQVNVYKSEVTVPVTSHAYGKSGASTGLISKINTEVGAFKYTGSTEKGMSGCGLFAEGKLVSIHLGVRSGYNTSISAYGILNEMARRGHEASDDMDLYDIDVAGKSWMNSELAEEILSHPNYKGDGKVSKRMLRDLGVNENSINVGGVIYVPKVEPQCETPIKPVKEKNEVILMLREKTKAHKVKCVLCKRHFKNDSAMFTHLQHKHVDESAIEFVDGPVVDHFLELGSAKHSIAKKSLTLNVYSKLLAQEEKSTFIPKLEQKC